jgi:hypothetical protein
MLTLLIVLLLRSLEVCTTRKCARQGSVHDKLSCSKLSNVLQNWTVRDMQRIESTAGHKPPPHARACSMFCEYLLALLRQSAGSSCLKQNTYLADLAVTQLCFLPSFKATVPYGSTPYLAVLSNCCPTTQPPSNTRRARCMLHVHMVTWHVTCTCHFSLTT